MRFRYFINEANQRGLGLTAFDIDDTLFHTFALIKVIKDGEITKELSNQEFNVYTLKPGETFDFSQFREADFFDETSKPIKKMLDKARAIIKNAKEKGSKVILLTARKDFDDKEIFLNTFRKYNFPIDDVYVERAGNKSGSVIADIKKDIIVNYLRTGLYRRVRLFDDDIKNCTTFVNIKNDIPEHILRAVRDKYGLEDISDDEIIKFEAFLVDKNGSTRSIK